MFLVMTDELVYSKHTTQEAADAALTEARDEAWKEIANAMNALDNAVTYLEGTQAFFRSLKLGVDTDPQKGE